MRSPTLIAGPLWDTSRMTKRLSWLLVAVAALCAAVAGFWLARELDSSAPPLASGTWLSIPRSVPDFQLSDSEGRPFTKQNLLGQPSLEARLAEQILLRERTALAVAELKVGHGAGDAQPGPACKGWGGAVKFARQPETGHRGAKRGNGHQEPGKSFGHSRSIPQRSGDQRR